ncbi:cobalt-precorrin-8X methylmutase CbiC [Paenibacillus larvae subsp. larvae]|uniref:Cobalt-precorrin-8X methylmutase CbiC n=1 Tax=Paenibacillus larvae subsp. larvae TaxID=147375 RepID=A0A2L1UBI1_9BACL|nr:cobalt-precorrin-8 methylmutase [Paenibacillus larvae]AQZ48972.1 precorrin-8X methylmutase [Paenibacillus larvae subsp. pulvifaciens]AVF25507.1 cobalt-precorrin-8X methylmutase CbiC [Paenibacillus larvae subsp. larvae]AVF30284.1 cobalt-precorrin-8X methylmutase CbiC [Paenibacillus larvae subsp. larvae]MBH0340800.1 precorrin-8X methylmutase [Paenibacillus larvae]MCY9501441.1 cobalt-precorrin-8 methylmutase [Paenibacillus larvae]
MSYIKDPKLIEEKSFEIIQEIITQTRPEYAFRNREEELVMKRAIHTTADFDYLDNLVFTHDALAKIRETIRHGGMIFTDTNMALSGMNKRILDQYGCRYRCYVNEPETAEIAKQQGITRSMTGIQLAAREEERKLFVIGNAPTAVYKILEMADAGKLDAEAVVGVPVGFVGAAESKEALYESDIPAVVARGRKGGSNLAAAIINAVLYAM